MEIINDLLPGTPGERVLLVMLPGAYHGPQDFLTHGFVGALRRHSLPVDIVAVDSHFGYFTGHTIVERLHRDVVLRAKKRGYRAIWFLGISLGAYGSLLYAGEHPHDVDGIIVLAPFLGTRGIIAEIGRAGGLDEWAPRDIADDDHERRLLLRLKRCCGADSAWPPIYLGYGEQDRFAAAHRMLAGCLPAQRVWRVPGGHDWATWSALWKAMVEGGIIAHVRQQ